ncbi:Hypothetical predicted protein [Cloeon dipterum]|uniref:Uncharacterized protein n=1 Tax=Cloeon dipterum TaxID=197152 RepID=A0A8S1C0D1_9INSE|nr:Hypothetical predicted protein [Cloeon dipterum]
MTSTSSLDDATLDEVHTLVTTLRKNDFFKVEDFILNNTLNLEESFDSLVKKSGIERERLRTIIGSAYNRYMIFICLLSFENSTKNISKNQVKAKIKNASMEKAIEYERKCFYNRKKQWEDFQTIVRRTTTVPAVMKKQNKTTKPFTLGVGLPSRFTIAAIDKEESSNFPSFVLGEISLRHGKFAVPGNTSHQDPVPGHIPRSRSSSDSSRKRSRRAQPDDVAVRDNSKRRKSSPPFDRNQSNASSQVKGRIDEEISSTIPEDSETSPLSSVAGELEKTKKGDEGQPEKKSTKTSAGKSTVPVPEGQNLKKTVQIPGRTGTGQMSSLAGELEKTKKGDEGQPEKKSTKTSAAKSTDSSSKGSRRAQPDDVAVRDNSKRRKSAPPFDRNQSNASSQVKRRMDEEISSTIPEDSETSPLSSLAGELEKTTKGDEGQPEKKSTKTSAANSTGEIDNF